MVDPELTLEKGLTMKKQERIKAAKAVALGIANGTPSSEWLHLDKAVKAAGCSLAKTEDGRVFRFSDEGGEELVFVCSKKQAITYKVEDWNVYKNLDSLLARAETQADVDRVAYALLDAKLPASLENIVNQGIEACEAQIRNGISALPAEVEAPKPEPKKIERLPRDKQHDEVCRLALELEGEVKFTQKREGACFWASGNVKAHKEELKRAGFVWSRKRQAYYWKPVVAIAAA